LARVQSRRGPRPVCGAGPEIWPGPLTDTDFHRAAMAPDASRPCAGLIDLATTLE